MHIKTGSGLGLDLEQTQPKPKNPKKKQTQKTKYQTLNPTKLKRNSLYKDDNFIQNFLKFL